MSSHINIVSWNVASLSAIVRDHDTSKLFSEIFARSSADIICLQETKLQSKSVGSINIQLDSMGFESWYKFHNCSTARLGHAGVLTMTKTPPISITTSVDHAALDREGRIVVCEFEDFYIVNVYVPNSGTGLINLSRRLSLWNPAFEKLIFKLNRKRPVIIAGDLNVARTELDIYDTKRHLKSPGFSEEERAAFESGLLKKGMVDTWRILHPRKEEYTFFSKRGNSRSKNHGWRLDYFLISHKFFDHVISSEILNMFPHASDHLPIFLQIKT